MGFVLVRFNSDLLLRGWRLGGKAFAVLTKPFVPVFQLEKYFYEKQLLITDEESEKHFEQKMGQEGLSGY